MADRAAFAELPLFVWLSPAFPVGGFAYSHGLEAAQEAGLVTGRATLAAWIDDLLRRGSIRQDALLLAEAWRAAPEADGERLAGANALALALCPSRERRLETVTMGNAFVATLRAVSPDSLPPALQADETAYPVAIGAASGWQGLDLAPTVEAFALAFVATLVSAAVRLGVIGQTDGQRVIAQLLPVVVETARSLHAAKLDDLGSVAFRSDLASLKHETQYTRLFRS